MILKQRTVSLSKDFVSPSSSQQHQRRILWHIRQRSESQGKFSGDAKDTSDWELPRGISPGDRYAQFKEVNAKL